MTMSSTDDTDWTDWHRFSYPPPPSLRSSSHLSQGDKANGKLDEDEDENDNDDENENG